MRCLISGAEPGLAGLAMGEMPVPQPGPGEVLIAVHSAALNFPDILLAQDLYQVRAPRPFIPGSEVAGVITAVGAEASRLAAGDRVMALMQWGGIAEQVAVAAHDCVKMPDAAGFDEASALLFTYTTSLFGLREAGMAPGDTVLVLGASGGVGEAAVQLAKALGARVIAGVSSEAKAMETRAAGADDVVIYPAGPLDKAARKDLGAQFKAACGDLGCRIVMDPVGGDYAEPAFRALAYGGRYVVLGFTAGIPAIPFNLPLLKAARIIGAAYGTAARHDPAVRARTLTEVADLFAQGRIRPRVNRRFSLDEAAQGLTAMAQREIIGKAVVAVR